MHIAQQPEVGLGDPCHILAPPVARPVKTQFAHANIAERDIGQHNEQCDTDQQGCHRRLGYPAAHEGKAGEKDQLPAERVEKPRPIRRRVRGQFQMRQPKRLHQRSLPKGPGHSHKPEDEPEVDPRQGHDHRHHHQDHHVHRQNVEIIGHIAQCHEPHDQVGDRACFHICIKTPKVQLAHIVGRAFDLEAGEV